jgi:hypothetical protein
VKNSVINEVYHQGKKFEESISSCDEKGLMRIHQGHCNLWLGLVKNIILKTSLVLKV